MTVLHLTGPVLVDDEHIEDQAWVVGGRITFERPRHSGDAARVHGWVLPGLVDVHCHVGLDSGGAVEPELALKQAVVNRDAGTLLIRDAGSSLDTGFIQERADMPRLIRAGRFIARPMRYLRHYAREIEVEDLPRVAAEEARAGTGWVKFIADWIDRSLGDQADLTPLWTPRVLADAVAAVHAEGARVTAHTFAGESIDALLDAGIDCIEHGTGMSEAQMRRAAAAGVPVVPTLLQVAGFAQFAAQGADKYPRYSARMQRMFDRRYEQVRAFHEAGVSLLLGTDAGGNIGHGALPAEAAEVVAAGIPAADVVASATWKGRKFLGVDTLTEGASADLVVSARDPREDIRELGSLTAVVLRGERIR